MNKLAFSVSRAIVKFLEGIKNDVLQTRAASE